MTWGYPYAVGVTATLIGYARCSTDEQDLTAQRDILLEFGVAADRTYLPAKTSAQTRSSDSSGRTYTSHADSE
jgi:DNA invertase Pin-like site-specific DNA recombinase